MSVQLAAHRRVRIHRRSVWLVALIVIGSFLVFRAEPPERLPDAAYSAPTTIEDWHGNSYGGGY